MLWRLEYLAAIAVWLGATLAAWRLIEPDQLEEEDAE